MADLSKIKPVYQELQGYLSQIPLPKDSYEVIEFEPIGSQINATIGELNSLTECNYDKFKVEMREGSNRSLYTTTLRAKLGGLIDRLHAEYFNEENRPFGGSPQTLISQTQNQSTNITISLVLQIQEKILESLKNTDLKPEEKNFLEKIKEALPNIVNVLDLIKIILNTANSFNITIPVVLKLLGL